MSQFAAALTGAGALIGAAMLAVARAWPATGRHRKPPARKVLDETPLGQLSGPWPEPAYGAAFAQAWRDCPTCRKATPGVLHKDGWRCGECLRTPGGAS